MLPTPPVLFIVYNRPDLAEQSFASIKKVKPPKLFFAADGPNPALKDDQALCQACRDFANHVDWDCEVQTLFRDDNLGCRRSMSSAITWFFSHVEEGIIVEDDCVAAPSFFTYCAELLDRYRDEEAVMAICGENGYLDETDYTPSSSYTFSTIPFFWGWATWRQAWEAYDDTMSAWQTKQAAEQTLSVFTTEHDAAYWAKEFDMAASETLDTWGYRWVLSCIAKGGLVAVPYNNLCSNVGFDQRATHTTDPDSKEHSRSVKAIDFPLEHPAQVTRDIEAEQLMFNAKFDSIAWYKNHQAANSLHRRVLRKIRRALRACA